MFNMCIRTRKHTHSELTRWSTHVRRNDVPSARVHTKATKSQRQRWCDGCKIFVNIYYNLFDIHLSAWTRRNRCGERPKLTKCARIQVSWLSSTVTLTTFSPIWLRAHAIQKRSIRFHINQPRKQPTKNAVSWSAIPDGKLSSSQSSLRAAW